MGGTQTSYSDPTPNNPVAPAVTTTQYASPNPNIVSTSVMDGMGHVIRTQLTSDPAGADVVDTVYTGSGQVYTVSNPYRATSTGGTTFTYDALGRKLSQLQPDGSSQNWTYNSNAVTFRDEAGNQWTHYTDGFGRLTKVLEPSAASKSPRVETDYIYDAWNNLQNATQIGASGESPRTRSFSYDSLSRLITSTNPETGTICYGTWNNGTCQNGYDANGNLQAKTDANGNTIGYQYDALNRLTGKTYNGSQVGWLQYDGNSICPGCQGASPNVVGRLAFSRATAQAGAGLQDQYFGYDPMGRLKTLNEGAVSVFGTGLLTSSFIYDLAGHPTSTTYEDGRAVYQQYDAAGHLCVVDTVAGSGCSPSTSAFVKGITRWPNGSPSTIAYGNGVSENISLNYRLQTCEMNAFLPATYGGTMFMDHQYLFSAGNTACSPAVGNNGNIYGIFDNTNTYQGSNNHSHWFTYDNLNRISSYTRGSSASVPATESYRVDSFGNISPLISGNPVRQFSPSTNRVSNLPCAASYSIIGFDAVGNQLCDLDNNNALMKYAWDPEAHLLSITGANTTTPYVKYSYQTAGERTRKDSATGNWTEYESNGGQVLSTHDQNGVWTDFIYANGQKIARTVNQDWHIHLQGYAPTPQSWAAYGLNNLPNYAIRSGDRILFRQYQSATARGGVNVGVNQNGNAVWTAWNERDQDGQISNDDGVTGTWHQRSIDLSRLAGGTLTALLLLGDQNSSSNWSVDFADVSIVSADGSVRTLYNQQSTPSVSLVYLGGMTNVQEATSGVPEPGSSGNVHYFVADHLGSANVELTSGGWPIWQAEYAPFGQEIQNGNPIPPEVSSGSSSAFKFTGKERDTESGLDYFGARYYGSSMGRFMSPDWSAKAEPVPYAKLSNPQSLNLYSYVGNNPLRAVDPDGHADVAAQCAGKASCNVSVTDIVNIVHYDKKTGNSVVDSTLKVTTKLQRHN